MVNCSFSAEPRTHYWDDLFNQAIMRVWSAGVVVAYLWSDGLTDTMSVNVWVHPE